MCCCELRDMHREKKNEEKKPREVTAQSLLAEIEIARQL